MRKINNNKLTITKKELLAIILAFTMTASFTGCKKNVENSESTYETTTITTEATTTTTVENKADEYDSIAKKLYDDNKDFFVNQFGENRDLAEKNIKNALLVLANKSNTVSNADLRDAFDTLDKIFMPTNVLQAAGNYITEEPIEHVENVPSLGAYVQDKQARDIINDNTALINNFINKMNNGTKEEKAAARTLILQRIVTVEENLDELYYLGEISDADELALNMSFRGLTNLAGKMCVNGVLKYTDKKGVDQTMFLIPDTYGAAVLNTFRFAEENNAPFDTQTDKKTGITVQGRYVEYLGPKGFARKFVTQAEKNTIEDTLVLTKYDEAVRMIQSEMSVESSQFTGSDCNTKKLTK